MGSNPSQPISTISKANKGEPSSRHEFIRQLKDFADNDPKFYRIRKGKYILYQSPIMGPVQSMASHEYVVIEFGRKLKKPFHGFTYAKVLRLDFGCDGYSMATIPSKQYWEIYGKEKNEKKGILDKSIKCRGTVDALIDIASVHIHKYHLATNNCKHFARQVWEEMVMPRRETYDL
eukprot:178163_1